MTELPPKVQPNGRYSIGATCAILGIHRNTLLRYTDNGLIRCGYRATGKKYYTGLEITRAWNSRL